MAKGGGFPGWGGNMQQMLKQAQKMQQDMARIQQELENTEIEASSGGGLVTVTITGKKELKSVSIKREAVDPDDVEMLEDLILVAVNEAMRKAEEQAEAKMAGIAGGLPGLF